MNLILSIPLLVVFAVIHHLLLQWLLIKRKSTPRYVIALILLITVYMGARVAQDNYFFNRFPTRAIRSGETRDLRPGDSATGEAEFRMPPPRPEGALPGDIPGNPPSDLPEELRNNPPSDLPGDLPEELRNNPPSDLPGDLPGNPPSGLPEELQNSMPSKFVPFGHLNHEKFLMDLIIALLIVALNTTISALVRYRRKEEDMRKSIEAEQARDKALYVRSNRKYIRIMPETISYIRGMNEYIQINFITKDEPILVHKTLKQCLSGLPDDFVQVQRSYIVNMKLVKSVETNRLILDDDTAIPIGDSYRNGVVEHIR